MTSRSKIVKTIPIGNPKWQPWPPACFIYTYIGKTFKNLFCLRRPWPLIFGYIASSSSHVYSTIRHQKILLLSSTPQPVIRKHSFEQILNIHSPMKINPSLLEYTRDNDTQVSELGPRGPSCNRKMVKLHFYDVPQKVASVLCYTVRNFECPSVCLGKHPRFRGYVLAILDIITEYFEVYYAPNFKEVGGGGGILLLGCSFVRLSFRPSVALFDA